MTAKVVQIDLFEVTSTTNRLFVKIDMVIPKKCFGKPNMNKK